MLGSSAHLFRTHRSSLNLALSLVILAGCGGSHSTPPAPTIATFSALPAEISVGQGTLLAYEFSGGTAAIDQGVGALASPGSQAVTPTTTTTYTLTANNQGVLSTATATVRVKTFVSKFVYVANAGGGVSGFTLDDATGALAPMANSPFDPSLSALHVTSDPAGKFLFVVNGDGETDLDQLSVYHIDPSSGNLTPAATPVVPTLSSPWCAAVDPTGKFVHVRCDGAIQSFSLDTTTGALSHPVSTPASAGHGDLLVHPSGLYLASVGRSSDQLDMFNHNPATGALTRNGAAYALPAGTGPLGVSFSHTGEFLFVQGEGLAMGPAGDCAIHGYHLDIRSGLLSALGPVVTGLNASDAYHPLTCNPTRSSLYTALFNSSQDLVAYTFNPGSPATAMTPILGSPYAWFNGDGSDAIVVSRNGKWAIAPDYNGHQIALAAVDSTTGALGSPTLTDVELFPVSVAVVGILQ